MTAKLLSEEEIKRLGGLMFAPAEDALAELTPPTPERSRTAEASSAPHARPLEGGSPWLTP